MVILVKPQFEVGKGQVGAGGIVRDPELHRAACERVSGRWRKLGFETRLMDSPILGAEGNREFLLYASAGPAELQWRRLTTGRDLFEAANAAGGA